MKVETVDLHGHNLREAKEKVQKNIDWAIRHGVEVLVFNHGKGLHSSGFAVLKAEIRKMLVENESLQENGFGIVFGESNLPIALTYDEGNTLLVAKGLENDYIGSRIQQQKHHRIFSEEGREERKAHKRWRRDK
ncbi:MAG: Smr/MutS family protein [Syntrophomonadaceae bacterium]